MKNFVSLLLLSPSIGLFVFANEKYAPVSVIQHKRQAATCETTYGAGSKQCGGSDSTFCYNPDQGQTCCAKDSGFCDAGKYCAPVAGYCCHEGEDLATCAKNAGFVLPSSEATSASTAPAASTVPPLVAAEPTVTSPTLTVTPFLNILSTSTQVVTPDSTSSPHVGCNNSTIPASTLVSNATVSPFVQVSLSVKRGRILPGPMIVVTVIGLFIASL
ncbi:hypothetical protein F5B20DRAFT_577682 [Whalleya microplaca]|nr:hypothetical protein F5B20DRAFT_577682 [Whalleya microplaca]